MLGAVVLAITGTEALYADMGHFGKKPIRLAWSCYVLPALLLNYFGQGALILHDQDAIQNPFYHMAPEWALYPLVILATMATVIASQAVITGTYSMTRQAIQLGYCPRLEVTQTSESEIGQIYMPWINWVLMAAVIGLVLGFESSSNLAGAYGIAVTGTMAIDTVLAFVLMRRLWRWPLWIAVPLLLIFLTIDLSFFSANAIKLFQGGWFPIVVAIVLFTLLVTWKRGRLLLMERLSPGSIPIEPFIQSVTAHPPTRVPGTAVFLTAASEGVPHALLHNLNHNKVLHERIVLLTVSTIDIPHVPDEERIEVHPLGHRFLSRGGPLWLQGRPGCAACARTRLCQGIQIRDDGDVVLPQPADADSQGRSGHGAVARETVRSDVAQRIQRDDLFQDSGQPCR